MVILTSNGSLKNHPHLEGHVKKLKSGHNNLKNILVLTSIFILLNNFTLIFAKSVNRPGVRFELSSEFVDNPNPKNGSKLSLSSSSYGHQIKPVGKATTVPTFSGISFGRLQRILLTTKDDSRKDVFERTHKRKDPHDNFDPHFDYDDLSFANLRAMPSSFEDAHYLSDDPSKNLSQFDNLTLGNFSVNSTTEGNSTLLQDDYNAIIMGIMSVVLGILILVTVIGTFYNKLDITIYS